MQKVDLYNPILERFGLWLVEDYSTATLCPYMGLLAQSKLVTVQSPRTRQMLANRPSNDNPPNILKGLR